VVDSTDCPKVEVVMPKAGNGYPPGTSLEEQLVDAIQTGSLNDSTRREI